MCSVFYEYPLEGYLWRQFDGAGTVKLVVYHDGSWHGYTTGNHSLHITIPITTIIGGEIRVHTDTASAWVPVTDYKDKPKKLQEPCVRW